MQLESLVQSRLQFVSIGSIYRRGLILLEQATKDIADYLGDQFAFHPL